MFRGLISFFIGIVVGIIVDILARTSVHTVGAAFWLGLLAFAIAWYVAYQYLPRTGRLQ